MSLIRNFVIIAHIDHGKSTLADRMLELTETVEKRSMQAQYLDQMDLERERGITLKMAPIRMHYGEHMLNLIDTPGHSDFSYEVSRALFAVEGAVLLVDATQGIQAQTLANFYAAQKAGLTIVGAINKIDMNPPGLETIVEDVAKLLGCSPEDIHRVSGKTGVGVKELLDTVVARVPEPQKPKNIEGKKAALVFDSIYDDHRGIIAHARVFGGSFKRDDTTRLVAARTSFKVKEVGYFSPKLKTADMLNEGEIGYIATGLKNPDALNIGDTIGEDVAIPGYKEPHPVIFVALYPSEEGDYDDLKSALHRLRLNDASFSFEPDMSEVLGRGFRCGFLGRLHFEIVTERLKREFKIDTISSFPSVAYRLKKKNEWHTASTPQDFFDDYDEATEPTVQIEIVTPPEHLGSIVQLQNIFHLEDVKTEGFGDYLIVRALMPLTDLVSDFDDKLKSMTSGFASFSYEMGEYRPAPLAKLEILVAGDAVPGLSRVVRRDEAEREGRVMLERLKNLLPRQQFAQALQAKALGRILAREDIPAMKKDVTGYLYGGDRTRKMKLWKKQKEGKKRLKASGRVSIEPHVFKELLKR